ncbi:MAG: single-stranded-DNA-specific exonuclease RecJ, partial [Fervidobacterium sp.]
MINKRWKIKEVEDSFTIKTLSESLNISEVLAKLLVQRNIKTFYQAKKFFRPSLEYLHDPFLMKGMDVATRRVIRAITENQLVFIYGDYDVDGTCATSLLYLFLIQLDANVD